MGQILTLKSQKNVQIVIKFFSLETWMYIFIFRLAVSIKSDELFNDMTK